MHFFYLDESGCNGRDLTNKEQPVFVLGGVSVRDEGWHNTQEAMDQLVSQYFNGNVPPDFELHASELLSPSGDGPFAGHTRERRGELAKNILGLLTERSHAVHLFAVDKSKLAAAVAPSSAAYDLKIPYLVGYDYLITYINWVVKERLGRSARGLLIIDEKREFHDEVERLTYSRRREGPKTHRVKWIVEFSYPIDSGKNPLVQLSDLVVFCARKFLEIDGGYRESYPEAAKMFYAECYSLIHARLHKKDLVEREGRGMREINAYLKEIQAKPAARWKNKYGV